MRKSSQLRSIILCQCSQLALTIKYAIQNFINTSPDPLIISLFLPIQTFHLQPQNSHSLTPTQLRSIFPQHSMFFVTLKEYKTGVLSTNDKNINLQYLAIPI